MEPVEAYSRVLRRVNADPHALLTVEHHWRDQGALHELRLQFAAARVQAVATRRGLVLRTGGLRVVIPPALAKRLLEVAARPPRRDGARSPREDATRERR